jgi:hypothetical protein
MGFGRQDEGNRLGATAAIAENHGAGSGGGQIVGDLELHDDQTGRRLDEFGF